jgi:hypothetical protein
MGQPNCVDPALRTSPIAHPQTSFWHVELSFLQKYSPYNQGITQCRLATNQKAACSNHAGRTKRNIVNNPVAVGPEQVTFFDFCSELVQSPMSLASPRVISSVASIWPIPRCPSGTLCRQPLALRGIVPWCGSLTGLPRSALSPYFSVELKFSSPIPAFIGAKPGT